MTGLEPTCLRESFSSRSDWFKLGALAQKYDARDTSFSKFEVLSFLLRLLLGPSPSFGAKRFFTRIVLVPERWVKLSGLAQKDNARYHPEYSTYSLQPKFEVQQFFFRNLLLPRAFHR